MVHIFARDLHTSFVKKKGRNKVEKIISYLGLEIIVWFKQDAALRNRFRSAFFQIVKENLLLNYLSNSTTLKIFLQ